MDIFSAIASVNAIVIAYFISTKKSKSISDYILIAWCVNFSIHFLIPLGIERQLFFHESLWGWVMGMAVMAHAPFIFVYTSSLTNPDFKLILKNLYHFGFLLVFCIAYIPYFSLSPDDRMLLVQSKGNPTYYVLVPMLTLLFIRIYFLTRTMVILVRHQTIIEQSFSYETNVNLRWIKLITYGFFGIIGMSIIMYMLVSSQVVSVFWMDYSMILLNMVLFYFIAYYGYKQEVIAKPVATTKEELKTSVPEMKSPLKLSKNGVPKVDILNGDIRRLNTLVEEEKLYLEPELHIEDIAVKMHLQTHHLSKLINQQLGKNFFEYINEYRVEEFKKLVADPNNKNISILGLAMDAGFNSKATFYRFFKNSTGLTPSEFKKSFDYKKQS